VVDPSFAADGAKPLCEPLADIGLPAARFVDVAVPVPVRLTVLGLFVALLVMVSVPVREPAAVGAKVTPTAQTAPTAMLVPQVLVWAKSPKVAMVPTDAAAVPAFRTVIDCDALVPPTAVLPNVRLAGSTESTGPGAVPAPMNASSSATWPAGQPVFAVMLTRRNLVEAAGNVMVTAFVFAVGSNE
jgi:hypothetical protein